MDEESSPPKVYTQMQNAAPPHEPPAAPSLPQPRMPMYAPYGYAAVLPTPMTVQFQQPLSTMLAPLTHPSVAPPQLTLPQTGVTAPNYTTSTHVVVGTPADMAPVATTSGRSRAPTRATPTKPRVSANII
jgi:hypothetical protein